MRKMTYRLPHVGAFKRTPGFVVRIFEHKRIHAILGSNLALMVMAGALLPTQGDASAFNSFVSPTISEKVTSLTTEHGLELPFEKPKVSQGFSFFHPGIDLTGESDHEPIYPIMAGRVVSIQHSKYGYGNALIIDHGDGLTSLYAHLSKILVYQDQEVTAKNEIGVMGATGHATGPHLHLEIRDHGKAIDPLTILPFTPSLR
jgi:murein DD-endopeptidase MepM/ murein hydrolase activator NlpD